MAKQIVEYIAGEQLSGQGGEVLQPYAPAPPMKPLGRPDTEAIGKLGQSVAGLGDLMSKLAQDNEEAIATTALMEFKAQGLEAVRASMATQGADAVATKDRPGITTRHTEARMEAANEFLDAQSWSDVTKRAARRAFQAAVFQEAAQVSAHETQQNAVVNQQAIDSVVFDAATTVRANPLDDTASDKALEGVLATLARRAPGNVNERTRAVQAVVAARLDGLIAADPDKASEYLEKNKALIGDKYPQARKTVTLSQVDRDAMINPGFALEKLGAMENGQPKYYQDLTPTERAATTSSIIAQIQSRDKLNDLKMEQDTEDSQYGYYSILNAGIDPRNPQAAVSSAQRATTAIAYLNERLAHREITTKEYEHLLATSKQGFTTDIDGLNRLKLDVELGRAKVSDIVNAPGIGADDRAALMSRNRAIRTNEASMAMQAQSLGMMQRQEMNQVIAQYHALMIPSGFTPNQDQVNGFLLFSEAIRKEAGKANGDPAEWARVNGWRFLPNAIPPTRYGTPKTLKEAQDMGDKLVREKVNMDSRVYNEEAAKITQAIRILQNAEATSTRK